MSIIWLWLLLTFAVTYYIQFDTDSFCL